MLTGIKPTESTNRAQNDTVVPPMVYDSSISEHFTFYTKEGMIQENHYQNVFDPETVRKNMEPFFKVQMIEDFVEEEKILTVGYRL